MCTRRAAPNWTRTKELQDKQHTNHRDAAVDKATTALAHTHEFPHSGMHTSSAAPSPLSQRLSLFRPPSDREATFPRLPCAEKSPLQRWQPTPGRKTLRSHQGRYPCVEMRSGSTTYCLPQERSPCVEMRPGSTMHCLLQQRSPCEETTRKSLWRLLPLHAAIFPQTKGEGPQREDARCLSRRLLCVQRQMKH